MKSRKACYLPFLCLLVYQCVSGQIVDLCGSGKYCENGGTCVNNPLHCICPEGVTGLRCEVTTTSPLSSSAATTLFDSSSQPQSTTERSTTSLLPSSAATTLFGSSSQSQTTTERTTTSLLSSSAATTLFGSSSQSQTTTERSTSPLPSSVATTLFDSSSQSQTTTERTNTSLLSSSSATTFFGSSSQSQTTTEALTCFACSGKDCQTGRIGTETCSNGDICSYVNIQIFIEEGNPVFLLERGCKSTDKLNADPCVKSEDYVGLDFPLNTTGEACFCDYSFCNNPLEETTVITDSSPNLPSTSSEPAVVSTTTMNSLQTTTFTDSKITLPSTSFEAPDTLTCFACSGKDCETGRIGTETCSNGDICSFINIQVFDEVGTPVFLLERGCKSANQFNADLCVTSADYVGLDFPLNTTGEACFCDYSFCNNPLEETTIITDSSPNLTVTAQRSTSTQKNVTTILVFQSTSFLDNFTLSWYVGGRNPIEGLFVQVQYHGMDDWFDISPKLEPSTRKFSLSAFEVINVTAVRVIAIDRSGNEIAESVPHPIRHLESGTRQNSQAGGGSVIFFVIVIIATIAISLVLIIIVVNQHKNKKLRQETVYSDIETNGKPEP